MIGFPNAKINIGLRITGKYPDGYHEIKTMMYPTGFCDILEFLPSNYDSLTLSGLELPGGTGENILWKTLMVLRKDFSIPPLRIHLHKRIPPGAGLGGGSADASFFMKMLNEYFKLNLSIEKLELKVGEIGSDCPFFIRNQTSIVSGKGEKMALFPLKMKALYLIILFPGFSVSTAQAYAMVSIRPETRPLEELLRLDICKWKGQIENEFENSIFPLYPMLAELKRELYRAGAVYSSMSGSGSAVFGIFKQKPLLDKKLRKMMIFEGLM